MDRQASNSQISVVIPSVLAGLLLESIGELSSATPLSGSALLRAMEAALVEDRQIDGRGMQFGSNLAPGEEVDEGDLQAFSSNLARVVERALAGIRSGTQEEAASKGLELAQRIAASNSKGENESQNRLAGREPRQSSSGEGRGQSGDLSQPEGRSFNRFLEGVFGAGREGTSEAQLVQVPAQPSMAASGQNATSAHRAAGVPQEGTEVRHIQSDQILEQIVSNARLVKLDGSFRFELQLKPEFLGKIGIQTVLNSDQSLSATITVENSAVKDLLRKDVGLLLQGFRQTGLKLENIHVEGIPYNLNSNFEGRGGAHPGSDHPTRQTDAEGTAPEASQEPLGQTPEEALSRPQYGDGRVHYFA
ncbi:MAG: flagellar hook-length control protein FliK [Acidobacteriota bacterium]